MKPKFNIDQIVYGFETGITNRSLLLFGPITSMEINPCSPPRISYRIGNHLVEEENVYTDYKSAKKAYEEYLTELGY